MADEGTEEEGFVQVLNVTDPVHDDRGDDIRLWQELHML